MGGTRHAQSCWAVLPHPRSQCVLEKWLELVLARTRLDLRRLMHVRTNVSVELCRTVHMYAISIILSHRTAKTRAAIPISLEPAFPPDSDRNVALYLLLDLPVVYIFLQQRLLAQGSICK